MKKQTCDELGVCQALPDCHLCQAAFAPYPFDLCTAAPPPRRRLSARRVISIVRLAVPPILATLAAAEISFLIMGLQ